MEEREGLSRSCMVTGALSMLGSSITARTLSDVVTLVTTGALSILSTSFAVGALLMSAERPCANSGRGQHVARRC